MRTIELLSPAKDLECGIEAIRHGADAVYIGASRYGARAAAGNSVEDIARLVEYAHFYKARVYATVNTILKDEEIDDVTRLIHELHAVHVDALIVQDMGILELDLPPIPLHASTQMDNRTSEKIGFLNSIGFDQVVLARELSLDNIKHIHKQHPNVALEVFVHGALCVSYSGKCYMSEACFNRSANRGECAQVCRMEFDLEDNLGNTIVRGKHLLSLKDMNRLDALEDLMMAGVSSMKIEGRLKSVDYVKNVTAAYSQRLNEIIAKYPDTFTRASSGRVEYSFTPDVRKSFNRGFTNYFLYGRSDDIFSFDTPKAMGEHVGRVKEVFTNAFTISSTTELHNGDGLCFIDANGHLQGFRLNKTANDRLYPLEMPRTLTRGCEIYRNFDQQFDKALQAPSATRDILVDICITDNNTGYKITMTDEDGITVEIEHPTSKELARSHQSENIRIQLSKLGGTRFAVRTIDNRLTKNWFIPSSLLGEWRRNLIAQLTEARNTYYPQILRHNKKADNEEIVVASLDRHLDYTYNVMNKKAQDFYHHHGATFVDHAFELNHNQKVALMTCKHCIRYSLGWCPSVHHKVIPYPMPLHLKLANGMSFQLDFNCNRCQMVIYPEEKRTITPNKKLPKKRR